MAMARWRLSIWLENQPNVGRKVHRQGDCKLCMIDRVMSMARETAKAFNIGYEHVGWKVERLRGVVDGWEIVYTSKMTQLTKVKRHAHSKR